MSLLLPGYAGESSRPSRPAFVRAELDKAHAHQSIGVTRSRFVVHRNGQQYDEEEQGEGQVKDTHHALNPVGGKTCRHPGPALSSASDGLEHWVKAA